MSTHKQAQREMEKRIKQQVHSIWERQAGEQTLETSFLLVRLHFFFLANAFEERNASDVKEPSRDNGENNFPGDFLSCHLTICEITAEWLERSGESTDSCKMGKFPFLAYDARPRVTIANFP